MRPLPLLLVTFGLTACSAPSNPAPTATINAPPTTTVGLSPTATPTLPPTATASSASPIGSGSTPGAPQLLGQWVHLYEQDEGEVQHWVAEGTRVPPSMFRETFTLEQGGTAKVLCAAADDAHRVFDGTWTLGAGGKVDIEVTCFRRPQPMHFTLVDATKTLLRLRVAKSGAGARPSSERRSD